LILDSKALRTALRNAGSIAALMLTTEALVAEIPEKKEAPMGGGGHGGGMDGKAKAGSSPGLLPGSE
jgi:chaperonin GroEL